MKWLTLDYIKKHSRIDYNCEDEILTMYAESAEETVLNYLNRSYDDLITTYGSLPKNILHASLMIVDVAYQYRSPISSQQLSVVPYTFDMLLKPYIVL